MSQFKTGDKVQFSPYRIKKAENRPLGSSGQMLPTDKFVVKHKNDTFEVHRFGNGHVQLTKNGHVYHQNWNYRSIVPYRKRVKLPEELFHV